MRRGVNTHFDPERFAEFERAVAGRMARWAA